MESECFGETSSCENLEGKAFLHVYKSVLNSKVREDSLVSSPQFGLIVNFFSFLLSIQSNCEHKNSHKSGDMYYYPNTAEQFCQVGAYSPQIRLPPPMEAIPRTRHSLSPMCFFNGGSCFLCHHPKRVPGNRKKFQTHVVVARFVLNQT